MDRFTPERLADIADKLERLVGGEHPQFTHDDAAALKTASAFVGAFSGDPAELRAMQEAWVSVKGFLKVGKVAGYTLGFLVLLVTNWERLVALFSRGSAP
jgi:hypothetical protein